VVAVEPENSAVLSGDKKGLHSIQGIGAGFVPPLYDIKLVNEVIKVCDEDAIEMAKLIAKTEGLSVGISGGAAVVGAYEIAKKKEFTNKRIVVIIPDGVDRYLSMECF
jgi:cysteine synthase A